MKILHVHNRYRFVGGEDIMYESIVRMLRQKGHKVFTFERKSDNVQGLWGKTHAFTKGIYSRSAKKEFSAILMTEHPDIVHVHNTYPLISPSVLVASREFGVPVVMRCPNYRLICPTGLHFRNGAVCELCNGGREYWCVLKNCRGNIFESVSYALRNVVARKWRLFQDNVTLFVPPSEFVKYSLVDASFPGEQIVVIPNMVSIPDSAVDPCHREYIAYAGRISPEKGIDTLLAAARETRLPVRLTGDYSAMPEIINTAPPNAYFVGHLGHDQFHPFYLKARFVVVPTLCFETFGLTAAEAMSHGLPVIASKIGGLPEVVEDGVTGFLFEPGDPDELAEKMKLLWENPDLCRRMGEAGREKAIREYSEDVYYERLIAVYEKAIEVGKES